MSWNQFTRSVTLSDVASLNSFLLNSYFENPTVELHVLYVINIHAKFHANQM